MDVRRVLLAVDEGIKKSMHPYLFSVAGVKVDTYYVLWSLALTLMLLWSRHRAVTQHGIKYNDATDVLFYVFVGGLAGAVFGGVIKNIPLYLANPRAILNYRLIGLSSAPGILIAGLAGYWKLRQFDISINQFADSTSIPAAFMMGVGRLGCFAAGCCYGVETTSVLGVHFPFLAEGVLIYPTQLFESIASFLIGLALLYYEKKGRLRGKLLSGSVFALFMMSYGSYRMVFDVLRADDVTQGIRPGQISGFLALMLGIGWLFFAKKRGERSLNTPN